MGSHPGASGDELSDRTAELASTTRELADLELAVASIRDYAIFVLDREGRVMTWNEGARRIKGYEPDEIIGEHFSRFYTEPDIARDYPAHELELVMRDGRFEDEGWRVRKDGTRFWANVVITALHNEDGRLVGFALVARDLTERRNAEQALRARTEELAATTRQLENLRLAVTTIRDYAIFLLDPDGRVLTWNEGARRIKGYEEREIVGEHFSRFYTAPDIARNYPAYELEAAERDGRFEDEGWRVRKDGTRFWANVVITALRNDEGRLVGFAKVTRDLTERRKGEEALQATAAELERSNVELERFAAAAAHDLAQPLHTIAGLTDLVRRRAVDVLDASALEALEHAGEAAAGLADRVDALLRYARSTREELSIDTVDVARIVDRVTAAVRGPITDRRAVVSRDDDLGAVRADGALIEVVLQNLLGNAMKYNDGPPRIEIGATLAEAGWRRIWVRDDGAGVRPEDQERIFQLFSRAARHDEFAGVGMGLPLCRQIVERHGGHIGVDSDGVRGSTFWFTLPAA